MKNTLLFFFFLALKVVAQTPKPTVIYLVRHAEKITIDAKDKDPLLTQNGLKRAKALAKKIKKIQLSAIYTTDYQRTRLTAEPISQKQNITVQVYDARQIKAFAQKILTENKGQNVLVVGHSNTVLETIEALGGSKPIASITDQEYDYFFRVMVGQDGKVEVELSHYGKKNTNTEGEQKMKDIK